MDTTAAATAFGAEPAGARAQRPAIGTIAAFL